MFAWRTWKSSGMCFDVIILRHYYYMSLTEEKSVSLGRRTEGFFIHHKDSSSVRVHVFVCILEKVEEEEETKKDASCFTLARLPHTMCTSAFVLYLEMYSWHLLTVCGQKGERICSWSFAYSLVIWFLGEV